MAASTTRLTGDVTVLELDELLLELEELLELRVLLLELEGPLELDDGWRDELLNDGALELLKALLADGALLLD
jgi:hypothetical protein